MLSHVIHDDVLSVIRGHLSSRSVMSLRSLSMKLMEFVTNLAVLHPRYLVAETPSLLCLKKAVLDLVYGSSRRCPGNFLVFI